MAEIRARDDLVLTVNRLMICAMEDIDSGRNEASPTTLDLVQRIEDCDAALRLALAEAQLENAIERDKREAAEIALAEDRCVCLCGCPISEHEGRMEDGEQCEHEDHECIRVAPAVLEIVGRVRLALETATRERDEARRTVKALTPAANYCLEYKPLLLKAEYERDRAVRVLREIAAYGWYAKGAKVARAYFSAKEGR